MELRKPMVGAAATLFQVEGLRSTMQKVADALFDDIHRVKGGLPTRTANGRNECDCISLFFVI